MIVRDTEQLHERIDDFGIDHRVISAFSRSGLWDHDPSEHLNIHSSHQVIAVMSGVILMENGTEKQPLYQRMAAFVPAGKPHRAVLMRENMPFDCHSLFISPKIFPVTSDEIQIFVTSDLCEALLKKMNENNLVDVSEGIMGRCLNLFLELLPSELMNRAKYVRLPEVKSERNVRVVRFVRDNYMNKVRLGHLTRAVPMSVRQITRTFRDETNMSPTEYLRLYRVLQASLLLHDSNHKIIDIALECGFQSPSTFYDEFRHHFGVSPNTFRRSLKS